MRPTFRPALVAAATVASFALSAGLAGAADAAEVRLSDARGDMWVADLGDTPTTDTLQKAPEHVNGDVLVTTFRHGARNIVVRTKYADLGRAGLGHVMAVRMRTNRHVRRELTVTAYRGAWRGQHSLTRPGGTEIACRASHKIDYARNTITAVIPRSCLGNPRWVQFTEMTVHVGSDAMFADNPHNQKAEPKGWTPRVRRG